MRARQMIVGLAAVFGCAAIAALGDTAWAQGVQLGSGQGAAGFAAWILGPAGIGSLIGLFIALSGIVMMAGRHTMEGILFVVIGAMIAGAANTIAGYFA